MVNLVANFYKDHRVSYDCIKCSISHTLGYLQYATKDLTLVAEFEGVPMQGETLLSVGYKYDLPKANASFKGVLNTQWNVCCVVEKRLDPLPASLTLSAIISHVSDKARFGIGFTLG